MSLIKMGRVPFFRLQSAARFPTDRDKGREEEGPPAMNFECRMLSKRRRERRIRLKGTVQKRQQMSFLIAAACYPGRPGYVVSSRPRTPPHFRVIFDLLTTTRPSLSVIHPIDFCSYMRTCQDNLSVGRCRSDLLPLHERPIEKATTTTIRI